jgi:pantothenate kinase
MAIKGRELARTMSSRKSVTMAGETTVSWEPSVAEKVKALTVGMIEGTRPLLVALVGIPGSGKSTSADLLCSMLPRCLVLPMDGFHLSLTELKAMPDASDAIYRRGAPDTFDPAGLERKLRQIRDSLDESVRLPGFDHSVGDPTEDEHVFIRAEHKVVIVEGLYLLHLGHGWESLKDVFDLSIFIEADVDRCIERLKIRNKCIPGYTTEEIDIRCDKVDRANAELVAQSCERAEVVVKSTCW